MRAIINQPNVPILYTNVGKLDVIYGKLNEFLEANGVTLSDTEKKTLDETKQVLSKEKKTLDVNEWSELSRTLLNKLKNDQLFPFLDIFKSLLLIQDVSNYYTTNRMLFIYDLVLHKRLNTGFFLYSGSIGQSDGYRHSEP